MKGWRAPLGTIVVSIVVWQLVVVVFKIPEYLLPPPTGVVAALGEEGWYLAGHTLVTLYEILSGFALAIVVGVPLGVLIVSSPAFERSVYPLLVASQSVPKIAIAPLLIFWAGLGMFPKILVAFLIAFFPIVIDTVVGLRSIEPEMLHLARSMGASTTKAFVKIRLPHALPNIFGGVKVAVTLAVVGAIVGEFIQADRGLGYALLQANAMMNTRLSFATIMILALIGVALFAVVDWIERLTIPWHASRRTEKAAGTL